MKVFTARVIEICENGDAIVEIPEQMVEYLGWSIGDNLKISSWSNEGIILEKVNNTFFDDVNIFMEAVGHEIPGGPQKESEISVLYRELIREEVQEYNEAVEENNDEKILDACFDMMWVIIGYMKSRGWNCESAWEEGALSNLAKIDPDTGKVIRREDGKILKPANWTPPDFKKFVS